MIQKIKVGAVSYLNTKPLIYGFEQGMMSEEMELVFDFPSNIARKLLNDEIDIGLVPVAVLPAMQEYHIIGDCCIGCNGSVASVCLFSDVPLDKIEKVLLDYQSRTSVALAKVLLREYWQVTPRLEDAGKDFRDHIHGATAGLVIGDRALQQRKISPYVYDLGEAWKQFTGLSFVFAAWISNKPLDPGFIERFNQANKEGFGHLPEIVRENPFTDFDLYAYFTKYLDYSLDDAKRKGLESFLQYLGVKTNIEKKEYFRP